MLSLVVLLLPFMAGVISVFAKNLSEKKGFAFVLAISQISLFVGLFFAYTQNLPITAFKTPWLNGFNINISLGVDGLSIVFVGLTVLICSLVLISSQNFKYENRGLLLGLILFCESALLGLFLSKDIFLFYFFFELALVPVYFLANIWGGKDSSKITFKMLVYTVFGSLFMLLAFVLLYMRAQSSDIGSLSQTVALLPNTIKMVLFFGFLLAFCIKTPVFPFHSWLPDTYSESPTPATMLLSGLLSKMGIYGILRILIPLAPMGISLYGHIIITMAIVGLIYGSIIAIKQDKIKRVLAFSSFSHMGLMAGAALTLSVSGVQGAIFQTVSHGLSAVGLFYIAKLIHDRTGSRTLHELGGIAQKAPKLAVLFLIILLSSIALPLTSGFIGEFLMLKSIYDFNSYLAIFAGLSIVFGAVYMLRVYQLCMYGEMNKVTENFEDLNAGDMFVLVPIALLSILFGIFPNLLLDISQSFVNTLLVLK